MWQVFFLFSNLGFILNCFLNLNLFSSVTLFVNRLCYECVYVAGFLIFFFFLMGSTGLHLLLAHLTGVGSVIRHREGNGATRWWDKPQT